MEASRLRLETYHLTKISVIPYAEGEVTPVGQYADFSNAEFGSEVTLHDLDHSEKQESRHGLELRLVLGPKEGKDFPYNIEVSAVGVFDATGLPEGKRDQLVLVNGASMLYSALREVILTLTHRCMHGPVMLPSVHFAKLASDFEKEQPASPSSTAALPSVVKD